MIELTDICRTYRTKQGVLHALADVNLRIGPHEFVVVQGPSGSGKTTFLWTLGAMLHPSSGRMTFDGHDIYAQNMAERNRFRAGRIGFVFQASHLLPYLSLRDNIRLGELSDRPNRTVSTAVDTILERLGLADRATHRPGELSAGEQQRAALARAIIKQPKLVLADEPAGNLDPENAAEVLRLLGEFHNDGGAVILVTHGLDATGIATRTIRIEKGRVVKDSMESSR